MLIDFIDEERISKDKAFLNDIWELYDRLLGFYKPRHREWRSNWALFAGKHFNRSFIYTNYHSQLESSGRKLMWNHTNSLTNRVWAKLARHKPNVGVITDEDNLEAENDAAIGKALIDYHKRRINYEETYKHSILNSIVYGMSCEYLYWDPHAYQDENNEWMGEPDIESVPMFELFWDPSVKRIEDMNWIIRSRNMKTAALKQMFPGKADKIKASNEYTSMNYLTNESYQPEDEVATLEIFLKPTPQYEKGLHAIVTREDVLKKDKWMHEGMKKLPFFFTHYERRDAHFFGGSPVSQSRPFQVEINKIVSHISQNQNQAGRPKIMVPRGANLIDGAISNGVTVIEYDGPTPPQYISPQSTPADVFQFLDQCIRNMEQIFNVQGASRGAPPQGVTSGIALQFLSEQESELLSPLQQRLEKKNADIWEAFTGMCHEYYDKDDKRIIKILGEDDQWRAISWDENNKAKNYSVIYQSISSLPDSMTARMQRLMEMKELAPEIVTNDVIIEAMELGNFGRLHNEITIDRATAKKENLEITKFAMEPQWVPSTANEFDNHMVHLREHNLDLKNLRLKGVPDDDPRVMALKDMIEQHEALLAEENFQTNMTGSQMSPDQEFGGNPMDVGPGAAGDEMGPLPPMTGLPEG